MSWPRCGISVAILLTSHLSLDLCRSFIIPLYLMAAFPMWVLGWMFFSLIPLWTDGADRFPTAFESAKWALIGWDLRFYGLQRGQS